MLGKGVHLKKKKKKGKKRNTNKYSVITASLIHHALQYERARPTFIRMCIQDCEHS